VERLARECPGVSYDVTIKIEHLLKHAPLLPLLRETGCLLVTSAVESVDDQVLAHLRKGHTRADFERALDLCRAAGVSLSPTFVAFTPWTTLESYVELLSVIHTLDLVDAVSPVQLGIRLLITANSPLLELPDVQRVVESYDPQSLLWPWRHPDPRVDHLQSAVMRIVMTGATAPRREVFERIWIAVQQSVSAGDDRRSATEATRSLPSISRLSDSIGAMVPGANSASTPPFLTEAWYCCAEPGPELHELV